MAKLTISGLDKLERDLSGLIPRLNRAAPLVLFNAMRAVEETAEAHAPVDTGNLINHIRTVPLSGGKPAVTSGIFGVPYAGVEEWGAHHVDHPGVRTMTKAFDEAGPTALGRAMNGLKDVAEK